MRKTYASLIVAGFAASLTLGACGGKPSEDDCKKFADKVVELTVKGQEGAAAEMAKGMIEAMKPEMIKECQEKGQKSEIDCALKAESLEDLEKCDGSKK
ncbi:MAG: hypothetical protein R3B09_14495 [Nannocystaceae bacterium]